MAVRPSLDGMPVEIIEAVVGLMSFRDICSLRLTAREVAVKSSHGVFGTYFYDKMVKVTDDEQLRQFIQVTRANQMGCFVRHLTLVAGPASRDHVVGKRSLIKAMANLRRNSHLRCLLSVSLVIEAGVEYGRRSWHGPVYGPDMEPNVWEAAAELFEATVIALGASKLRIRTFDVFGQVTHCSLAIDQIAMVLAKVDLSASFQILRRLSISLSHPRTEGPEREGRWSLTIGERNTKAICKFLGLCPKLEELQLHWYRVASVANPTAASIEEQQFFDRVAESCQFPSLKRGTLKGIHTSESALLLFLSRLQRLESLVMDEFHLGSRGKFGPVFDYLFEHRERLGLEYVHLDDLYEEQMICFDAPGKPRFARTDRSNGPHTTTRTEADERRPIGYRLTRGHAYGSAPYANWLMKRSRLYGPR